MAVHTLRGQLDQTGPTTAQELVRLTSLPRNLIEVAAARLEGEGFALPGRFDPTLDGEPWCSGRLLIRIHGYTQQRLRREIEPVSAHDFMRFLLHWHPGPAPGTSLLGFFRYYLLTSLGYDSFRAVGNALMRSCGARRSWRPWEDRQALSPRLARARRKAETASWVELAAEDDAVAPEA